MDEILHGLTNRNSFNTTAYSTGGVFRPSVTEDADVERLRRALGLDRTDTDWFVHGIMMAVDSHPDVRRRLPETGRSCDPLSYRRQDDSLNPGVLVMDGNQPPKLAHVPLEWPPPMSWTMARTSPSAGFLRVGTKSWTVPCNMGSNNLLTVVWPDETGAAGAIDLSSVAPYWTAVGDTVMVNHEPCAFPYGLLVASVEHDTGHRLLMNRAGTWDGFLSARTAFEKTAFLGVTVALLHATVWTTTT
jgi:hypothetical protein